MNSNPKEILETYLYARRPLIYIHNFDFQAVDKIIAAAAPDAAIFEFSDANGKIDFETKTPSGSNATLAEFLEIFVSEGFKTGQTTTIVVLKEIHDSLAGSKIYSLLQTIVQLVKLDSQKADPEYDVTVIIVDSKLTIPPELEKLVTLVDVKPPAPDELGEIIDEFCRREYADGIRFTFNQKNELLHNFAGLAEYEIKQILELALVDVEIGPLMYIPDKFTTLINLIHKEKRQAIKKTGLLEIIEVKAEQVGGLNALRRYLDANKAIFNNPALAAAKGVSPLPAGVMIVGMPGCGKSLSAKYIAREFKMPLLRLDVGRLLGKYVGESEENLRRAIAIAESSAPCILWIDEIEKAFAGIGSGGGEVTTRMFGYFLTWMQEKSACIYVVATANDISNLPPEFLRRGRFDEIFQVGFPSLAERKEIFEIQLKKRNGGKLPSGISCEKLAGELKENDKYSGADIESIVKESMKQLFVENMKTHPGKEEKWRSLTMTDISRVISETKSSYHSQKQKLDVMLAKLKELDVRSATS